MASQLRKKALTATARGRLWIRRRVRPGLRWAVGSLLIIGGMFGFMPVLGFWMIPLGIAVAALDVKPAWQSMSKRRRK